MVVGLVEQIQNLDRSQTYTRTGVAARLQPFINTTGRRWRRLHRPQFGDRFSVARNDDFLAV
jgi:hypothetical protein